MRTTARLAAAALSTTLVVGATATSAFAQSDTIKDKSSDVLSFADQTTDTRGTQLGSAESVASGVDLRSLKVEHGTKNVTVKLTFSNLADTTTAYVGFRVDGKTRPSRVFINTSDKKGIITNVKGDKKCSVNVKHRYGTRGTITATFKRSCLGTPKRLKASAFAADPGYFGDNTAYKADAVSKNTVRGQAYTKWLKAS